MSRSVADFQLLGVFEALVDGRSVPLGGQRQRSLLAVLLVNANADVGFDRIVDTLWEEPPRSARQQVYNATTQLRGTLVRNFSEATLVTAHDGYRIDVPKHRIDVFRFQEHLREATALEARGLLDDAAKMIRRALDLWRGQALTGLGHQRLDSVAAGLDEQRLAAIERLTSLQLLRGESTSLVGELMAIVAEHPLREPLRAGLMTALHRAGRQAEALAVFEEGRRILAEELGLDPGPQLRMLQELVLRGDPAAAPAEPAAAVPAEPADHTGAAPVARDLPPEDGRHRYLPRDIHEFTGRREEIAQLLALARRDESAPLVISAIDGMGGVGKTTLATHIAHSLATDYPDGHYFVDLQGFTVGVEPLSPTRALQVLLRQNGVPAEQIPADLEGQSTLWRSRVAGRRVILFIDNAVDVAQVRPLLPATSETLILITTRRRFTALEGAVPLSLGTLPIDDAITLFLRIAGIDRADADREGLTAAVELCGRLPLAVRIAAARLRECRSWSIGHLVSRLAVQQRRGRLLAANDRDVLAVIALSYRYLTATQQRVFRLLSLHPGPELEAHAVAALARMSVDDAEAVLEDLFAHNLLLQDQRGRYSFHDLVRDCAHGIMADHESEVEQEEATTRLLDHYLDTARAWCRHAANPPFRHARDDGSPPVRVKSADTSAEAMANLQEEHRNFVAVIARGRETGHRDRTWQLTCALQPYLKNLDHVRETIEMFESALDDARAMKDDQGVQLCLVGLALAYLDHGSAAQALGLAREALREGSGYGPASRLSLLSTMSRAQMREGLFHDARASLFAAQELAEELEEWQMFAVLTNNLGVVLRELGDLEEALRHFRRIVQDDMVGTTPQLRAGTLNNIAHVHYLRGSLTLARDGFLASLDASRAAMSRLSEVWCLIGLCSTYRALGDHLAALGQGREALKLAQDTGMVEAECDAFSAIGDVHLSTSSLSEAAECYARAASLAGEHGLMRGGARAHEGLAHVHFAQGGSSEARRMWRAAVDSYGPVEAESALRHLDALVPGTTCRRCETMLVLSENAGLRSP